MWFILLSFMEARTGLSRLVELQVLHSECARLSDGELLVLPGEEPNCHLGGHWISFSHAL